MEEGYHLLLPFISPLPPLLYPLPPQRTLYLRASQATGGASEPSKAPTGATASDLPTEYLQSALAREPQVPVTQSNEKQREMQEQDDIQIAIAMSLNEQENKVSYLPGRILPGERGEKFVPSLALNDAEGSQQVGV